VRILQERLVALTAVLFLALALSSEPTAVIAGVAAVLLITAAMAVLVTGSRELTVGARAHAHREAMSTLPAPAHPSTAGRPRTRAPSMAVPAT
jgi:protein-S-isoprenylcysteine O-methyltransferase Ste14